VAGVLLIGPVAGMVLASAHVLFFHQGWLTAGSAAVDALLILA
jgi:hypothetical protein